MLRGLDNITGQASLADSTIVPVSGICSLSNWLYSRLAAKVKHKSSKWEGTWYSSSKGICQHPRALVDAPVVGAAEAPANILYFYVSGLKRRERKFIFCLKIESYFYIKASSLEVPVMSWDRTTHTRLQLQTWNPFPID